jgi:hypothetical protein
LPAASADQPFERPVGCVPDELAAFAGPPYSDVNEGLEYGRRGRILRGPDLDLQIALPTEPWTSNQAASRTSG